MGGFGVSGTIDTDHTSIGDGTASFTEGAAPTIPRASTPSFVGGASLTTGTAVTINTNWASSSFNHTIVWNFGSLANQTGGFSASTGIGASLTWTPPVTMLAQIPNAASGSGTIVLTTKSGTTTIGTKTVAFTLTAAGTVIPTISGVTILDQNATVVAQVGAYVQSLSDLRGTVNAAGVQTSTITSSQWSMSGQTVASGSNITPMTSGSVAIGAAATDSRGRTVSYSSVLNVMPYVSPKITSAQVRRATALGALNDNGTSLQLDLNAAVQSLISGTEKNTLTIKVFTRLYGTTPWTARNSFVHTAVSYNTAVLITGGAIFPSNQSFDVKIEITDKFNTATPTTMQMVVSTSAIFMHWSQTGVGIGKYHTQGVLDIAGNIYQSNNLVVDVSDAATTPEINAGTNNVKYITPLGLKVKLDTDGATTARGVLQSNYRGGAAKVYIDGVLSSVAYDWATPYDPGASRTVVLFRTGNTWIIAGQDNTGYEILPLNTAAFGMYADWANNSIYASKPKVIRLESGIVVLSGLINTIGAVADNTLMATLPVGTRPDTNLLFTVECVNTSKGISVNANGEIRVYGGAYPADSYVSLEGISWPAAGVATWTAIGSGGSSFAANWINDSAYDAIYGFPSFWKDPYGLVWFRGLIKCRVATSVDGTNMIMLPTTHRADLEQHMRTISSNNWYGGVGARSTDGLNWKTNSPGGVGAWMSLAQVTVATPESRTLSTFQSPRRFMNNWVRNGGTQYPNLSYALRGDGMRILAGLAAGGSGTGMAMFVMTQEEFWPTQGQIILNTIGNSARSRVDICGTAVLVSGQQDRGAIIANDWSVGSWLGLDNMKWVNC